MPDFGGITAASAVTAGEYFASHNTTRKLRSPLRQMIEPAITSKKGVPLGRPFFLRFLLVLDLVGRWADEAFAIIAG